jgi:hypothetical protein
MKNILIPLFSALCFISMAQAADNFEINRLSAADLKASAAGISSEAENEMLYQAGAAERARILKEALKYVKAEKSRPALPNAFLSPAPANIENAARYSALREKNAGFISNLGYWKEQMKGNYSNLEYVLRMNDLTTANILLNYMRRDHWAIINERAAIKENNLKAAAWPRKQSNEQLYAAGAGEREAILAQAAAYSDLEGRDVPKSSFMNPTPAGIAYPGGYEELRAKNEGFIGNIQYWRYQLEGNYENLKDAVRANDLETARILLNYLKKDSRDLDNEIRAVERNNAKAEQF